MTPIAPTRVGEYGVEPPSPLDLANSAGDRAGSPWGDCYAHNHEFGHEPTMFSTCWVGAERSTVNHFDFVRAKMLRRDDDHWRQFRSVESG